MAAPGAHCDIYIHALYILVMLTECETYILLNLYLYNANVHKNNLLYMNVIVLYHLIRHFQC